jgi:cobalt-zinc-cadmium efflux system membrane fusion protein
MRRRTAGSAHGDLLAVFLTVLISATPSCQSKQEEPAESGPTARSEQHGRVLDLPEVSPALAALKTERVAVRPIRMILKAQAGKILANENQLAHLSSRVPGRIVAVHANLGDLVRKGDRLLILDSAEIGQAQFEYRKAKAALFVAAKAFDRAKVLLDRGAIGTADAQKRQAEYETAQANIHEAEEKLHLLGMSEQEINRLTGGNLPHAEVAQVPLRAPFTGEVIERNATVGEVVDSNKSLFTIADLSTVWVQADFPEQQVSQVKIGLPLEVRVRAYPNDLFTGKATYVGAVVNPATRTVMVRSEVPNPDRRLRPEMFADVSIVTEEHAMLTVARAALQQAGDQVIAFVVLGPRRFERRDVVTGQAGGEYAEVKAGLKEGEEVVTQGSYALKSEALREQMPGLAP